MDGGFRLDNEPAHQHTNGDENPVIGEGGNLLAQITARRGKAHIDPCEEKD